MAKKHSGRKSDGPKLGGQSPMDLGLLEQITRLMRDNDLNTIEVRDGDKRVILKRGAMIAASGSGMIPVQLASSSAAAPASHNPGASSGGSSAAQTDIEAGMVQIKSPMVGTFYSAPSPDAKAFVNVGSTIDEETDVCVIEAMKVFNNIKAELRGTINKILVTNGQTVEFGQPLFLVKPA